MRTEVLIVGAGPCGLALALWLTKLGVAVRIVDRAPASGLASRAFALQARSLELYDGIGLAQEAIARGRPIAAMTVHIAGHRPQRVPFGNLGRGLSPFPFVLILLQDDHEKLLIDRLAAEGVQVERGAEVIDVELAADHVRARLKGPGGADQVCEAGWLCGCDGAGSTVRELLKIGFPGGSSEEVFYVADITARGALADGELHYLMAGEAICSIFPLHGEGRLRLIGLVPPSVRASQFDFSLDDVAGAMLRGAGLEIAMVQSFASYRVHERIAERWRRGRAFILGDASHAHSPAGGQGLNAGIGDAANLAWKLAAVLRGRAGEALLDTFETEGVMAARQIAAGTDRGFAIQAGRGGLMDLARQTLAGLAPGLMGLKPVRRAAFQAISQLAVTYRGGGTCDGRAGRILGGDRLPWVRLAGHTSNFDPLRGVGWQLQVYDPAEPRLREACAALGLSLHDFAWDAAMARAGFARGAAYLIRPDGYVAYAATSQDPAGLERYLARYAIRLTENERGDRP
jgi:2-polyprenyl-6-methoxyphenol hydroxylase-like FAD-dependent oxidoreductase